MKNNYFLMLLASAFLLFSCRTELDTTAENNQNIQNSFKGKISSELISIKSVKEEVRNWNDVYTSLKKIKTDVASKQSESDKIFYRKVINNDTKVATYNLAINSYTTETPYYLIQQIIIPSNGTQRIQYLKIIPNKPPLFKTQDVLPTLTGSIETLDENLNLSHTTNYENGKVIKNSNQNENSNKGSTCVTYTEIVAVPCSNGGEHSIGQTCNPGYTNDAHYEEYTYTVCFYDNPTTIGGTTPPGGAVSGGYVFDQQLNSLLINPTFQYADYITDPNHNLLLQAVRQWIPNNITNINGDLSALNQRIQLFVENEQMFSDLETYNLNTPNVMNAEVTDYSVRVYDMFNFLLNYPTLENGAAARYSVAFLDKNRLISWNNYFKAFKYTGKYFLDNPDILPEDANRFIDFTYKFLRTNPNITFNEFWTNKHKNEPNSSIDIGDNISGNYDETIYENFNFENQQTEWPTINSVIPISDFVGWGADGIRRNCMDYAKAQIAKKGYKISNYYDVDSQGNKQTFQIYTEQNGVNLNDLYKGVSYLKYALSHGIPVIVGIDDKPGHPGNLDQSTDHFVVVVGMGKDSNGKYFTFYDNASGDASQGANPNNKLYVTYPNRKITGQTQCAGYRADTMYNYIMTMIRKSK